MADVSVSVKLTQKQAGALYMKSLRQADQIKELKAGIRRIITLAEASKDISIVFAAKALLEPKPAADQNEQGGGK